MTEPVKKYSGPVADVVFMKPASGSRSAPGVPFTPGKTADPPPVLLSKKAALEMVARSGASIDEFTAALKAGEIPGAELSTSGVKTWTIPEPAVLDWIGANGGDVDAAKEA